MTICTGARFAWWTLATVDTITLLKFSLHENEIVWKLNLLFEQCISFEKCVFPYTHKLNRTNNNSHVKSSNLMPLCIKIICDTKLCNAAIAVVAAILLGLCTTSRHGRSNRKLSAFILQEDGNVPRLHSARLPSLRFKSLDKTKRMKEKNINK